MDCQSLLFLSLDNEAIKIHAKDTTNYGTKAPFRNAYAEYNEIFTNIYCFFTPPKYATRNSNLKAAVSRCRPNKYVEYYIKECGDILGVSSHINNPDDPKAILHYIFQEIVKYKSSSLS